MASDLPEWLIAGRETKFLEWFIRNMVADQAAFTSEDIAIYAQAYARPGALRAGFDVYRTFWQDAEDNRRFAETKLRMPVLAIGAGLSVRDGLAKSLGAAHREPARLGVRGLRTLHPRRAARAPGKRTPGFLRRDVGKFTPAGPGVVRAASSGKTTNR